MRAKFVRMPKYPECWESCGSCASGEIFILELLVELGQEVGYDEPVLTLETGKVALDIPTPYAGKVIAIHVTLGDPVAEGQLLLTLQVD